MTGLPLLSDVGDSILSSRSEPLRYSLFVALREIKVRSLSIPSPDMAIEGTYGAVVKAVSGAAELDERYPVDLKINLRRLRVLPTGTEAGRIRPGKPRLRSKTIGRDGPNFV
jgi:hypothetical protein